MRRRAGGPTIVAMELLLSTYTFALIAALLFAVVTAYLLPPDDLD